MTFEEAMEPCRKAVKLVGQAYLHGVVSSARSVSEAAAVAGKNRTDFYRLCDSYGVDIKPICARARHARPLGRKRKRPWRYKPMGV